MVKNETVSQLSKNIEIKYHFIRDIVSQGVVELLYVPTNYNVADMFTKTVSKCKMDQFKCDLFG